MRRLTHYHVAYEGRTSRPFRYAEIARAEALKLAGIVGTPSGFQPSTAVCYRPECMDPPVLSQARPAQVRS